MRKTKTILGAVVMLFIMMSACKKESTKPKDNNTNATDLTTQLVGAYSSIGNNYLDSIVISKISNQTVSVIVYRYFRTETYTSTLTSATAFQLKPTVQESSSSSYTVYSADGLLTPATNQLSYDYQWTEYSLPDSAVTRSGNPAPETLAKFR